MFVHAFVSLGQWLSDAAGVGVLGVALLALLTTPRRAEVRRQGELVDRMRIRLDDNEEQLREELERRTAAEAAAARAEGEVRQLQEYAIGPAAYQELLAVLHRLDTHLSSTGDGARWLDVLERLADQLEAH